MSKKQAAVEPAPYGRERIVPQFCSERKRSDLSF